MSADPGPLTLCTNPTVFHLAVPTGCGDSLSELGDNSMLPTPSTGVS